jgi:hypothetical protein
VANIDYVQLPAVRAQLAAYQEQAQATEAGHLVLKELAEERAVARGQLQLEGQRALRLPLKEEQGDWRDWSAYAKQVRQSSFDILEVNEQPTVLLHLKSGETSDLVLLQPGGINAPALPQQVAQELNEQQDTRWRAERMLVDVLAAHQFTSQAELNQQLQQQAYKRTIQPDGTT